MLGRIEEGADFFCLDSAYLARKICDAIAAKGMTPRIRPKSNTVCKNGGSQAWGDMTRTHRDELARFMDEYHQRSIIEAVFGAIKRMYGNHLRSRRRARQSREIAIRVICYNIEVVARSHVKKRQAHARVAHCNGCLTGAVTSAPSVGEPAHHPLDRMGFYSFGQHLKPAVCEKCHNPKNSKNACTDATTADDCGVMSLGYSQGIAHTDIRG